MKDGRFTWSQASQWTDRHASVALLGAMLLVLAFLQARGAGVIHVGPDEWLYSKSSRLLPLAASDFTSYLYLWTYRSSNSCGTGFMECVRLMNGLFVVMTMPFVYMVCRRVAGTKLSLFVTFATAIGPASAYSARFMPESMYHFGFWVLTWFCLGKVSNAVRYGSGVGAIIGLLALVKLHALFLLPAVMAFILVDGWLARADRPPRDWLLAIVATIIAAAAVRFSLGYAIAGPAALSLLGELYGGIARPTSVNGFDIAGKVLLSLKGHAMAISLLFAVPVAALLCPTSSTADFDESLRRLKVFTLLCLVCLVIVTALFTARVAGHGEQETIGRLHMRYYVFVLPLLVMIAANHAQSGRAGTTKVGYLVVGIVAVLIAMAMMGLRPVYHPSLVDNPHLFAIADNEIAFWAIGALSSLSLLAWAINAGAGARLFLFAVVPLVVLMAGWRTVEVFTVYKEVNRPSAAAAMTRHYLGARDTPILVVAPAHLWRLQTMFYLDSPNVQSVQIPPSGTLSDDLVPANVEWILALGRQRLPWYAVPVVQSPGVTLAQVRDRASASNQGVIMLDFREQSWPGVSVRGLSRAERWGTWSNARRVEFNFEQALPRSFTLVLEGHAIDNIDKPFSITAGHHSVETTFPKSRVLEVEFSTEGGVRSLVFDIPWARTFGERGIEHADPRRLGIGFVSMRIVDNANPRSAR